MAELITRAKFLVLSGVELGMDAFISFFFFKVKNFQIYLSRTYDKVVDGNVDTTVPSLYRQPYEIPIWRAAKLYKRWKNGHKQMNKWCRGRQREGGGLTHLFDYVWREDSGGKGSAEDVWKLLVEAADTHPLEIPIWADDGLAGLSGLGFPLGGGQKNTN